MKRKITVTSANFTGIIWYRFFVGKIFEVVAEDGEHFEVKHLDDSRYYVWKRDAELFKPETLVGRAFRGTDGLIRWITHFSTRKYFTLLWLDEHSNVWHSGGIVKAQQWKSEEEVAAPQKGDVYRLAGATGLISERTV